MTKNSLNIAQQSLRIEAEAITEAARNVSDSIERAAGIILDSGGKIVVTGLGKSGIIAQKIASTLRSIGTPAVFIHAAEAFHGDLGIYNDGDVTIILSKSGTTPELFRLMPILQRFNSPVIAILGNTDTGLASKIDCIIDASVKCEADPLNLAPTASSTLALAIGDALAATLIQMTDFSHDDFAEYHPGGQLGKNLERMVENVMHRNVPAITTDKTLKDAVVALSYRPLGAVCIVEKDRLCGIVTDGDVRRAIQKDPDINATLVTDIMNSDPVSVPPDAPLTTALDLMENRASQISVLPVVKGDRELVGLIRLHDIYQAGD